MKKNSENSATLVRVLALIKPYLWLLCLSLVFAVVTVITTLYAPVLTGQAIDCVVEKVHLYRLILIRCHSF